MMHMLAYMDPNRSQCLVRDCAVERGCIVSLVVDWSMIS
jgi:hypothetical protein